MLAAPRTARGGVGPEEEEEEEEEEEVMKSQVDSGAAQCAQFITFILVERQKQYVKIQNIRTLKILTVSL